MINIPELGHFKWHPFTLSSTPLDDYLGVHIKAAGDWTKAAHRLMEKASKADRTRIEQLECSRERTLAFLEAAEAKPFPSIYIHGPLGAPAQNFGRFPVVVLVGGGIGATPMISIIKFLLQRQQRARECPADSEEGLLGTGKENANGVDGDDTDRDSINDDPGYEYATTKDDPESRPDWPHTVYFHWLTRDTKSFRWFADTMNQVAEHDQYNMLRIFNHLTSASPPQKQRVVGQILDVAKNICVSEQHTDLITGLHTNEVTSFGRPNWDSQFHKVLQETAIPANDDTVNIGVFVCGPNKLSTAVHDACMSRSSSSFKFKFHRERF